MADQEQFLEAFLNSETSLRAFLGAVVRDRQDRQDVFQDVALTLWRKFDQYDPRRPFGAWARGIAAKKVLQHRAKSGKKPTPFSPQAIGAIVDAMDRVESRRPAWPTALDALEKCVESLPLKSRNLLEMRYGKEWSIARVAEQIAGTSTAVCMALSRVRMELRECVEQRIGRAKEQDQ